MESKEMTFTLAKLLSMMLILGAIECPLFGQATGSSQTITGIVSDASGGLVPEAGVTVRDLATDVTFTATTTATGRFSFPNLPVGTYQVKVTKEGFKTVTKANVSVLLGTSPNVTITLPVGASTQIVTVSASLSTVDTTSTTTGLTRSTDELSSLPVEVSGGNRDPLAYLDTYPGVEVAPETYGSGSGTLTVQEVAPVMGVGDNGGEGQPTGYKVDGIMSNFFGNASLDTEGAFRPAPDLIQEMRLVTNSNADDGWDLGTYVELVTKSGTNRYRGSAYEYLRNNALDARNTLSPKVGVEKQDDFGVIVGGPIKKDKDFFIVSYSGYRQRLANTPSLLEIPTASEIQGNLSQFLGNQMTYANGTAVTDDLGRPVYQGAIYDPTTTRPDGYGGYIRDPFAGNIVPPAVWSKVSSFFNKGWPSPNYGGGTPGINYETFPLDNNIVADNLYVKTDFDFSTSQRLSVAYEDVLRNGFPQCGSALGSAYQGFGAVLNQCMVDNNKVYRPRANYAWTIGAHKLFTLDVGGAYRPRSLALVGPSATAGAQAGLTGVYTPGVPFISIANVQPVGAIFDNISPNYWGANLNAGLSWVTGNHQFKFGYQVMQLGITLISNVFTNGYFSFSGTFTGLPDLAEVGNPSTGQATAQQLAGGQLPPGVGYADFLLGYASSGILDSSEDQRYSSFEHAWFAEDQWRLTPKLTINYGLRYDLFQASDEEHDRIGNFCPTCPNPGAGNLPGAIAFFGNGPGRNGQKRILNTYPYSFEPRLGVAYAFNSKTVGRLYYGIQRYPMAAEYDSGRQTWNYGWGTSLSTSALSPTQPAFLWDKGTFSLPTLPSLNPALENGNAVAFINPNDDVPGMAHSLGASIERQLPRGYLLRAEYAGKLMHNLPTNNLVSLNSIPFADAAKYGAVLSDPVNSPAAQAAGIAIPYSGFSPTQPVYQALVPYPQFQQITEIGAEAKNVYWHALMLSLQKQFGPFTLLANFTAMKELTNDPVPTSLSTTGPVSVQYPGMDHSYWFDTGSVPGVNGNRPEDFVVSWVYHLPVGRGERFLTKENRVVDGFLGGWQLSGIQSYAAGTSFTVGQSTTSIPTFGPIWPDRVQGQPIGTNISCGEYDPTNPARNQYLNPTAFADPAPFQLGNTYVPNFRLCGYRNEDFSLMKTVAVTERYHLTIGADAFNAFNRHMWYSPLTVTDQPASYGHFTAATNGRSFQLHMKLDF
jgi:hypothetical protein